MFDGKTIIFWIRGIAGHPSDQLEWEYEARDQTIQTQIIPAIAISYATTFLTVWDRRKWRGQRFAHVLRGFTAREWRVHIVGHSEGTVVATDALKWAGWPRVESLHLICGACDSDIERLGVSRALRTNLLGQLHVYVAGRDRAMWWENLDLGKKLFGLRRRANSMGLCGPQNVDADLESRVHKHDGAPWDRYDHSTCWNKDRLQHTVNQVLANCR